MKIRHHARSAMIGATCIVDRRLGLVVAQAEGVTVGGVGVQHNRQRLALHVARQIFRRVADVHQRLLDVAAHGGFDA